KRWPCFEAVAGSNRNEPCGILSTQGHSYIVIALPIGIRGRGNRSSRAGRDGVAPLILARQRNQGVGCLTGREDQLRGREIDPFTILRRPRRRLPSHVYPAILSRTHAG